MRLRRRHTLNYPRLGFPDLMQLIVLLNTQPDVRIDPHYSLELKRRLWPDGGFPRDDLVDEFHRAFASSKNVSLPLNRFATTSYALFFFNAQLLMPHAIEIFGGLEVQSCVFNYTVQHLTVVIRQVAKREQCTDAIVG